MILYDDVMDDETHSVGTISGLALLWCKAGQRQITNIIGNEIDNASNNQQ